MHAKLIQRLASTWAVCGILTAGVSARADLMISEFMASNTRALADEDGPERQLLIQDRGMDEAARESFLAQFSATNQETLVALAVTGGIFGEGIDLVGERLISAVIVGVGVPQVCLERDLIKEYFDRNHTNGFAYAYQYPGFKRVLQATGRVIRTEVDRGIIVLIDERFTHARYRQLFPSHWRGFHIVRDTGAIKEKLVHFWSQE